jgi:hypothetical protein
MSHRVGLPSRALGFAVIVLLAAVAGLGYVVWDTRQQLDKTRSSAAAQRAAVEAIDTKESDAIAAVTAAARTSAGDASDRVRQLEQALYGFGGPSVSETDSIGTLRRRVSDLDSLQGRVASLEDCTRQLAQAIESTTRSYIFGC